MTKPNFYELIKKEQELIQRLEKILDKLENPILIFPDPVNNSETIINVNKMFNGEPVINPKEYSELKKTMFLKKVIFDDYYVEINKKMFEDVIIDLFDLNENDVDHIFIEIK